MDAKHAAVFSSVFLRQSKSMDVRRGCSSSTALPTLSSSVQQRSLACLDRGDTILELRVLARQCGSCPVPQTCFKRGGNCLCFDRSMCFGGSVASLAGDSFGSKSCFVPGSACTSDSMRTTLKTTKPSLSTLSGCESLGAHVARRNVSFLFLRSNPGT